MINKYPSQSIIENLTFRLDPLFAHIVHLAREHLRRRGSGVDAVRFDGYDDGSSVFQEMMGIETDDTCLIGLSDVSEDDVDHLDEHSVFLRVAGVLDNG